MTMTPGSTATLAQRLRQEAHRLEADHRAGDGGRITLADIAALHGSAFQGSMLVLLAAPCLLPIPGIGNVMGTALVLLSLAMWRRQVGERLPQRVATVTLSAAWGRRVLALLARCHEIFERWSRERLPHLAAPSARFWTAPLVALMGVVIFLPVPLGNVLPACSLLSLGCGLAVRDGLAMLLGAALGLGSTAYAAALALGAWAWIVEPLLSA
jgi:hypothetical protein